MRLDDAPVARARLQVRWRPAATRTIMTERLTVPDPSDDPPPPGRPSSSPPSRDPEHGGERDVSRRLAGGAGVVLAARGIVAFELAQWPQGDLKELDLAVERLALQGHHLAVPIEALIVELKNLVERHAGNRRPEHECRPMREHLVSVLIEAYYRAER